MKRLRDLWPLVLLVLLLWIVRYWHSFQFGLYEDDLTHLPTAAAMSLGEVFSFAFDPGRILRLEGQGHPLVYSFIYVLTNLGWRIGGLHGPYWIGFAIEALNVCLFYVLLSRVHGRHLALLAGLAYVLYSADTTQAYLTYSLGVHPSLTFFLLAALAYVSGRRWPAYLLAPLMLLTYETVFPVFFAVPLLSGRSARQRIRELLLHSAVLGLIVIGFSFWRLQVGDDRLGGLAASELILVPLLHMAQGPVVSLGTYVYRAVQALQGIDLEVAAASVTGTVFFAWLSSRIELGTPVGLQDRLTAASAAWRLGRGLRRTVRETYQSLPSEVASLVRLVGAGAVMLVLAYPFTFTVRAYAISGRDTRVHAAGVLGAAILLGSMALLALWTAEAFGRRRWVVLAFGVWVGLLAGYGFVIQRDYVRAWELQRSFWRDLLPQIQDAGEGTVVIVDPAGLIDTVQIGANTWNLPRILEQLYRLPSDWDVPPRVYRGEAYWREYLVLPDGSLRIYGDTTLAPLSEHTITDWDHLIVIHTGRGVVRRKEPLVIDAVEYALAEPGYPNLATLPRLFLYEVLVGTDGVLPPAALP